MRHPLKLFLLFTTISVLSLAGDANARALRIATWNMEHLADTDGEGCRPRSQADYEALKRHADRLDADIIAVQEVENEQALARVFDPSQWSFEVSRRPDQGEARECRGEHGKYIITQRTGFVIKKPLRYTRNPDLAGLDVNHDNHLRYGVDITLEDGVPLRLLAIHLKSGCHAGPQASGNRICTALFQQGKVLKTWVEQRSLGQIPFVILGDFNRRLQQEGDFWTALDTPGDPVRDLAIPVGKDTVSHCDTRYPQFIDFLVFNPQSLAFVQKGSFQERVYEGKPASDHCPVAIDLAIPDLGELQPEKGKISAGLKWYRRSAEFRLLASYVYAQATQRIDAIKAERHDPTDWVVSLDADETILDNSLAQLENEALGLGFEPERWKHWLERGAARAIPGAIAFMNHVLAEGGKLVIITNRDSTYEELTRQNLVRLGLRDDRRTVCVLGRHPLDKQADNPGEWQRYGYKNDKDRRRRLLREGNAVDCWAKDVDGSVKASWNRPHRIVLWLGDNIQDMPHMTQQETRAGNTPGLVIGRDYFLLPNPMYGSWTANAP